MNDKNQELYKDEIQLVDILLFFWRWKYLIIGLALVFAATAAFVSTFNQSSYVAKMVINSGLIKLERNGKKVLLDSPKNIKAYIEAGAYSHQLNDILQKNGRKNFINYKFRANILNNLDLLEISTITMDSEIGIAALGALYNILAAKYEKATKYYKEGRKNEVKRRKFNIDIYHKEIQSFTRNLTTFEEGIEREKKCSEDVKENALDLIDTRNKYFDGDGAHKDSMPVLLYSGLIQENLNLMNNCYRRLNDFQMKKEKEQIKIFEANKKINKLMIEIEDIVLMKDKVQNIQVVRTATAHRLSDTSNVIFKILLASAVGAFVGLIYSLSAEYVGKYRRDNKPLEGENL